MTYKEWLLWMDKVGAIRNFLPDGFPKIITLCGSSRFKDQHEEVQANLTLEGNIVIPMGLYGHLQGLDMQGDTKKKLDELHFRKIDLSDAIFVVNHHRYRCVSCKSWEDNPWGCNCPKYPPHGNQWEWLPYIGESTKKEIEYAKSRGREIMYLNPEGGT